MTQGIGRMAVTVGIGVLLAGPLAALAYAGAPERWRSGLIPFAALSVAVLVAAWLRGRETAGGDGRTRRPPSP
jgi:4-amino-4-deoxy-L-arabinose transferase-like glycosyltransferase